MAEMIKLDPLRQTLRTRMFCLQKHPEWLEVRNSEDTVLQIIQGPEMAEQVFARAYREHLTGRGDAFILGLLTGLNLKHPTQGDLCQA